jgi:hypothetical protein
VQPFALGVPLVLLIWAGVRREPAMVRLLGLYWKVASLLPISVLLLTDRRPIGYCHGLHRTRTDGGFGVVLGGSQ